MGTHAHRHLVTINDAPGHQPRLAHPTGRGRQLQGRRPLDLGAPMSHPNAALTPRHRLIVGRLVADDGWPISEVAARFQVSWPPASPTPRSTTTKPPTRPQRCWFGPSSGSTPAASPSSASFRTTAAPTAHTSGETPAPSSASSTSAPGRTGRGPTARSRDSTTLADGWAYPRCYTSEAEPRVDGWLHYYNHHRPHTACGNQPPFSRLTNVSGQYI